MQTGPSARYYLEHAQAAVSWKRSEERAQRRHHEYGLFVLEVAVVDLPPAECGGGAARHGTAQGGMHPGLGGRVSV